MLEFLTSQTRIKIYEDEKEEIFLIKIGREAKDNVLNMENKKRLNEEDIKIKSIYQNAN